MAAFLCWTALATAEAFVVYSVLVAAIAAASFDANRMLIQTSDSTTKASVVYKNVSEGSLDMSAVHPKIVRTVKGNQPEQVLPFSRRSTCKQKKPSDLHSQAYPAKAGFVHAIQKQAQPPCRTPGKGERW